MTSLLWNACASSLIVWIPGHLVFRNLSTIYGSSWQDIMNRIDRIRYELLALSFVYCQQCARREGNGKTLQYVIWGARDVILAQMAVECRDSLLCDIYVTGWLVCEHFSLCDMISWLCSMWEELAVLWEPCSLAIQ